MRARSSTLSLPTSSSSSLRTLCLAQKRGTRSLCSPKQAMVRQSLFWQRARRPPPALRMGGSREGEVKRPLDRRLTPPSWKSGRLNGVQRA